MSWRSAGSCLEPVMGRRLIFLLPRPQRGDTHTLLNPNLKLDTQARRNSPSAFFLGSPSVSQTLCWASLADQVPGACPIDGQGELDPPLRDTKIRASHACNG